MMSPGASWMVAMVSPNPPNLSNASWSASLPRHPQSSGNMTIDLHGIVGPLHPAHHVHQRHAVSDERQIPMIALSARLEREGPRLGLQVGDHPHGVPRVPSRAGLRLFSSARACQEVLLFAGGSHHNGS